MAGFASSCSTSIRISLLKTRSNSLSCFTRPLQTVSLPIYRHSKISCICKAKKRDSPLLKQPDNNENVQVEEEEDDDDDDDEDFGSLEEFEDGTFTDADDFLEDGEEAELRAGDGAGGGGISLAGTEWDNKALAIAEETLLLFNGELKIYAFQTLKNCTIRVRVEKLSNRSGSPSMADIEEFSSAYRAKLDEAEEAGSIPGNTSLEVSSPGVERVVQIPQDLDRFKERPMYVKYFPEASTSGSFSESDGVFKLVSFDLESECCTWGIADVKINREKAGKGRPLNKKQREWRLITPFQSLRLVTEERILQFTAEAYIWGQTGYGCFPAQKFMAETRALVNEGTKHIIIDYSCCKLSFWFQKHQIKEDDRKDSWLSALWTKGFGNCHAL